MNRDIELNGFEIKQGKIDATVRDEKKECFFCWKRDITPTSKYHESGVSVTNPILRRSLRMTLAVGSSLPSLRGSSIGTIALKTHSSYGTLTLSIPNRDDNRWRLSPSTGRQHLPLENAYYSLKHVTSVVHSTGAGRALWSQKWTGQSTTF